MATYNGTKHAETISGNAADDFIFGDNGNDILNGNGGNDRIDGGNGADTLNGGAGEDELNGGNGQDTVVYAGKRSDYHLTQRGDGTVAIRDLRPGAADGTDRLISIERVQFSDGTFKIVDIISSDAAPVAADDAFSLAETAGPTVVTSILLANDSDADGDAFKVTSVQAVSAAGASVSVAPDGTVTYDAGSIFAELNAGQTATDSFTYTITDANGLTSTATATVTITGVTQNQGPVAGDDGITLAENAGPVDLTANLLGNDTDADGDALKITSVQATSAKGATVTVDQDGKVVYDAGGTFEHLEEGETATDTFTYTVTDAAGATSTATATVTITGVSFQPDAYFFVDEDGFNDQMFGSIVESFGFEIVGVETQGLVGSLEFDLEGGILTFTADHDSSDVLNADQQQWTYFTVIGDAGERKVIGMVIGGVNDAIVAVDDAVAIGEGETLGNLYKTLLTNEIDPDNSVNTRQIVSVETTGTLGAVAFDPSARTLSYSAAGIDLAPGETITDTFTYTSTDGNGTFDTATVTVTVTGGEGGGASASAKGDGVVILGAFAPEGESEMPSDLAGFASLQPEMLGGEMLQIA